MGVFLFMGGVIAGLGICFFDWLCIDSDALQRLHGIVSSFQTFVPGPPTVCFLEFFCYIKPVPKKHGTFGGPGIVS